MKNEKINSLTGARFLAIAIIVLSHCDFLNFYEYGDFFSRYLDNAQMGVDFFFMLSGFGMMLSYMKKSSENTRITIRDLLLFAIGHVKKIYKLFFVMQVCGMFLYMYEDMTLYGGAFIHACITGIIKLVMTLTLLQSLTGMKKFSHMFNGVSWFLSCLFCIYLVSPVIMKFLKDRIKTVRSAITVVILSILFSSLLAQIFMRIEFVTAFDDLRYGSPYRRIFYVICGMAIAQIYRLSKNSRIHGYWEFIIVPLAIGWFLARNTIIYYLGNFSIPVDMVICSGLLYVISRGQGKITDLLQSRVMVYLGNISMYIYLIHFLLIIYMNLIIERFDLYSPGVGIAELILVWVITLVLSMMLYKHDTQNELKSK